MRAPSSCSRSTEVSAAWRQTGRAGAARPAGARPSAAFRGGRRGRWLLAVAGAGLSLGLGAGAGGGLESAPGESGTPGAIDGARLFATMCGWCHHAGGRAAGKGPKLAGTTRSDAELIERITRGREGAMPAFGRAFTPDQIRALVGYIRGLRDESP